MDKIKQPVPMKLKDNEPIKTAAMGMTPAGIAIKPYSITELAQLYGVTNHTMKNWIMRHGDAVGEKVGRLYTVLQVQVIFEKLGLPGNEDSA